MQQAPTSTARTLGALGLMPFAAGAFGVWFGDTPAVRQFAAEALATYAAVIVSFLGGIHWGLGMRAHDGARFEWAVVPSLLAWPALLLPQAFVLPALAAALVICLIADRRLYPAAGMQGWMGLRWLLTTVAVLACAAGAAGVAGAAGAR